MLIVDIGASRGDFTNHISNLKVSGRRISCFAIEPQREIANQIIRRPNVEVFNGVVGSTTGAVSFFEYENDELSSTLRPSAVLNPELWQTHVSGMKV